MSREFASDLAQVLSELGFDVVANDEALHRCVDDLEEEAARYGYTGEAIMMEISIVMADRGISREALPEEIGRAVAHGPEPRDVAAVAQFLDREKLTFGELIPLARYERLLTEEHHDESRPS